MARPPDILNDPITRHMRSDYVALRVDLTVEQALASLRQASLAERIVYFYVKNADDRLVGVLPTRRLLMNDPSARIGDLMSASVISIPSSMSVADACEFFVMHRLFAFPVVDADDRLLGVVDVSLFSEEMFDLTERQASDDVFQLIGVHAARARGAWGGFRYRFPWMLCNIGGGIACAALAAHYEATLQATIVLALFIPVVLALSESVSMQAMTLALQGLHGGRADWRRIIRMLVDEFRTACLLGVGCGILVGVVVAGWKRQWMVAAASGAAIALAMVTACLLGVLIPALVRALRVDPKVASGPVVLAAADIATLLYYFGIASWLVR